MKKVFRSIIVMIMLVVSMCFTVFAGDKPKETEDEVYMIDATTGKRVPDEEDRVISFNDEELDTLKDLIVSNVENLEYKFVFNYTGEQVDYIGDIVSELLDNTYGANILKEYSMVIFKKDFGSQVRIDFTYYHTYAQEIEIRKTVNKVISKIITEQMTDREKIKAVNEYITGISRYSNTNSKNISVQSPYSLIDGGEGVCQAYATLTYRFLQKLNIEQKLIVGNAGGAHLWNKVKIDGKWLNLDVTWNDTSENPNAYTLISDEQIEIDHDWNIEKSLPNK